MVDFKIDSFQACLENQYKCNVDLVINIYCMEVLMSRFFKPRTIGFLLILVVLAALTFGFAAENTVTASKAGYGETTVSGYTVTVSWDIDDTNPTLASDCTLDFGADSPTEVWASVYEDTSGSAPWCDASTYGAWINCVEAGTTATCTYTGSVQGICGIRVSAGD